MIIPVVFGLALLPYFGAAYLDEPPTTAAPDTIPECSLWHIVTETDTCASISADWFITEAQFSTYNPSVADSCELVVGNSYCVEKNWGIPDPTPTSTTPTPTPTPMSPAALAACEAEAGGYKSYCERCAYRCTDEAVYSGCFDNTFRTINYYDSQCWQHGGRDCENQAADIVCPRG
ncbi:hypothetical protein C7974DRAFT_389209 [Boeremia exigua]|uniref:uncharacterized protein n=1 Tax=Boeremia exigua TaxID=749465 RepID=UPI001E8E22C3|nr:uncharacterized protein C7974DRAFT_389209 [Boeremia exigua]KAH6639792.1 hypothetical protein C7974DRAFT_389209 [Boeremia exigua]